MTTCPKCGSKAIMIRKPWHAPAFYECCACGYTEERKTKDDE